MSLEGWFRRAAASELAEWLAYRGVTSVGDRQSAAFDRRWVTLLRRRLLQLKDWQPTPQPSLIKAFVWNVQYAASRVIWDESLPLSERTQLIESLPEAVIFACRAAPDRARSGAMQFWDSVPEYRDLWGTEESIPAVMDAIVAALGRQLTVEDECCQLSALHGIFHLNNPDADALVDRFRGRWATEEVQTYAQAMLDSAAKAPDHAPVEVKKRSLSRRRST